MARVITLKHNKSFHPRNKHIQGYDFQKLCFSTPELKKFLTKSPQGTDTINFARPEAVRALNKALLKSEYNIENWTIPDEQLCPPIPSRVDYIHHIADLIGHKQDVRLLDIGTGANGIYALIAAAEYGWHAVGVDINQGSLQNLQTIIDHNPQLQELVTLKHQTDKHAHFTNIIQPEDTFTITVCNPPFHSSADEALKANQRKNKNLGLKQQKEFNFGGIDPELWCKGGEALFLKKMVKDSVKFAQHCHWFTTLVSKQENLAPLEKQIKKAGASDIKVIDMKHGQKKTRILAWTFENY
ncbi:MAG: 23S rRNA (adenine(1618)-N(6))-methyltransferase RlmF [Gammaproteobacteria bacterium]|nr:23S rRNA (adenine(1618)-N(6))-methyltransferase RlmF [Gammaproteobacteria bacterium]HBF08190.1 23S rRNA (adenine(1618)-N(6))-methyltransferase RlmF [Gammaproteobacteria bacterium]